MKNANEILNEINDGVINSPKKTSYNKGKFLALIGEMSDAEFRSFCLMIGSAEDSCIQNKGLYATDVAPEYWFEKFINSKSDACSLEVSLAEQTDKEWMYWAADSDLFFQIDY